MAREHKERMSIVYVSISELTSLKFNPETRVGIRQLKKLKNDIDKHELHDPIKINQHFEIIDGHRRVAACKALGFETMPVLVRNIDDEARNQMYVAMNTVPQNIKARDWLGIYLDKGPVGEKELKSIKDLENIIGIEGLCEFRKLKLSADSALKVARGVQLYIPDVDMKSLILTVARKKLSNTFVAIDRDKTYDLATKYANLRRLIKKENILMSKEQ